MPRKPQNQLTDLHGYSGTFVTVRQLSDYWNVSQKHVLRLIEMGHLQAVRLGPKTQRVLVDSAVAFERQRQHGGKSRPES